MSDQTHISWCDSTFNPWMGCTKVSPACDHCYAERDTKRFGRVEWGAGKPRIRTKPATWEKVERWNQKDFMSCTSCSWRGELKDCVWDGDQCPECGGIVESTRRRVFCASLADVFDNEVDPAWRADLFALIEKTPNLDWLLLTKRIGNVAAMMREVAAHLFMIEHLDQARMPPNVWLGVTVINQDEADRDVPKLLKVPASVRFLSIEPMLGAINMEISKWGGCYHAGHQGRDHKANHRDCACHLDWVICGGESGPHARPIHPNWVRTLRDQCVAAGVAFHFKQWGGKRPKDGGCLLDGLEAKAWPLPLAPNTHGQAKNRPDLNHND